ncbi:hypothetical protein IJG90_00630 [Candidatus Saccharibacteria bacterium]|nr:hypothetical protein [Candidatus Saccharibacteria bacterium]
MKIYISGISGTGMGPLALMAKAAGLEVAGSDLNKGAIYDELIRAGIEVFIGEQDGEFLQKKIQDGVEWFVYTSALPKTAPELEVAKKAGLRVSKRDSLTDFLVRKLNLKMVAVAGTHGKTTTTAMIVWACLKLGLPVAYVVGSTLGFAPSGNYKEGDEYFIYEADEYDRNFLEFYPWLSVITSVSYDHPDIYKTREDYEAAFEEFRRQSENVLEVTDAEGPDTSRFSLAGEARRQDAAYALGAVLTICQDLMMQFRAGMPDFDEVIRILNEFPGVGRRFEKINDGVYTDYAHHPEEIKATMDVALDECKMRGYKGVVVVYQPHQNTRQHEVRDGYVDAFDGAEKVYWLPTYLTRENLELEILEPEELAREVKNAEVAELNNALFGELKKWREDGYLVLLMTAGPADVEFRDRFGA